MLKDHLNKLEYFVAIVEAGSLLKASSTAYVSQPQLSKILKQLEEAVGESLVIRSREGVSVTEVGERLYNFSKETLENANKLHMNHKITKSIVGRVRVGTYDSISRYFFPEFLRFTDSSLPGIDIVLTTGKSKNMLDKLQALKIDMAIIVGDSKLETSFEKRVIYSDSFGHYQTPKLSTKYLNYAICYPRSLTSFEQKNVYHNFKEVIECDNLETVKALAENSMGVAILPHQVAKDGVLKGKLIQNSSLSSELSPHDIYLVFDKNKLSDSINLVIQNIERFLGYWAVK